MCIACALLSHQLARKPTTDETSKISAIFSTLAISTQLHPAFQRGFDANRLLDLPEITVLDVAFNRFYNFRR